MVAGAVRTTAAQLRFSRSMERRGPTLIAALSSPFFPFAAGAFLGGMGPNQPELMKPPEHSQPEKGEAAALVRLVLRAESQCSGKGRPCAKKGERRVHWSALFGGGKDWRVTECSLIVRSQPLHLVWLEVVDRDGFACIRFGRAASCGASSSLHWIQAQP